MRLGKYFWILLLISVAAVAQENKPAWSTEVGDGIQWTYLSETLIVAQGRHKLRITQQNFIQPFRGSIHPQEK